MNTIEIRTKEDLIKFKNRYQNGEDGLDAVLLQDIDLNPDIDVKLVGAAKDGKVSGLFRWEPMGRTFGAKIYKGNFDGAGHTISGIYMNDSVFNYLSFFSGLQGVIRNLTVDGYIRGGIGSSGICAINYGLIQNCENKATICGKMGIVGICGFNDPSGEIKNCTNSGTLFSKLIDTGCTGCIDSDFKYSQIAGGSRDKVENCKGKGTVLFPYRNSLLGNYLQYFPKLPYFEELLRHDPDPSYRNSEGNTYLHIVCQNEPTILDMEGKNTLLQIIARLGMIDEIDFTARNNEGKRAASYLHNPEAKELVKAIIKERKEQKSPDTFSDIGF